MNAGDFGVVEDAYEAARADVAPVIHLAPAQRYARFLDVVSFFEGVWRSLDPDYLADWGPKTLDPSVDAELRVMLERARRELEGP